MPDRFLVAPILDSPVDHRRRQFEEMLGVMEIGREANPEVEVETTGDLFRLGQEEIQRQIEDDFGLSSAVPAH